MENQNNHSGFAALEGLLILIIVGLIGFVGWRVMNARQSVDRISSQLEAQPIATPTTSALPTVNSADDLNKTQKSLDAETTDDNTSDLNQLDAQLSGY